MNFSGGDSAKAWKDIWGAGQGLGAIKDIPGAGEVVERMIAEYNAAKANIAAMYVWPAICRPMTQKYARFQL